MTNETVSVRYMVDDVQEAIDFYTGYFGFVGLQRNARLRRGSPRQPRLLLAGPTSSAGRPMPDGAKPGPGGWNRIHFIVDDIAAEVERLRATGASFRNDIISGPGGKQILVDDPSGNPIELFQPRDQSSADDEPRKGREHLLDRDIADPTRCRRRRGSQARRLGENENVSTPPSPLLSPSQLAALAEIGEERSAPVGELLYRVGDRSYPFVAIVEGEVAILDAAGNELVRHGPSRFLGELNLLSGQTVFVNALVTEPLRYIAVERRALRSLLDDDGPLSDLVLSTLIARREALQSVQGIGLEIVGPHSSEATMRTLEFVRANRLPYTWQDAPRLAAVRCRSCDCPAEESCTVQRPASCCGRSGSGSSWRRARRSTF